MNPLHLTPMTGFLNACESGDLTQVKHCLKKSGLLKSNFLLDAFIQMTCTRQDNHQHLMEQLNAGLSGASSQGHVQVVQYLLTSKELKLKASIRSESHDAFVTACESGHFNVVKYILSEPELAACLTACQDTALLKALTNDHIEIANHLLMTRELIPSLQPYYIFSWACNQGETKIVDYLFNHVSFTRNKKESLLSHVNLACISGQLEVVKYFINRQELMPSDLQELKEHTLVSAHCQGHTHIVNYLLYDLRLEVEPHTYIEMHDDQKKASLMHLVGKRDLFFKMNQRLTQEEETKISSLRPKI